MLVFLKKKLMLKGKNIRRISSKIEMLQFTVVLTNFATKIYQVNGP